MRISISFAFAIAAALIPQIASAAASMQELEQEALKTGKSQMIFVDSAPIKVKAARGNFIAETGCAFVTVSYITKNPTAEAPNKILVFETTSPVCPAGDEKKAVELGGATKG